MDNKGFTLVELMIAVAIIGILAAIAVPNFILYRSKSRMSEAKVNLGEIGTAAESYRAENETYHILSGTALGWNLIGQARYDYWYDGIHVGVHSLDPGGNDHSAAADADSFLASAAGDVSSKGADTDQWTYNQARVLNHPLSGL